jgi:FkbM family methyltransferase
MFVFSRLRDASHVLGLKTAVLLRIAHWFNYGMRKLKIKYRHPLIVVQMKGYPHPVHARLGSSDSLVLDQIFIQREYSTLDNLTPSPKVMIDCGANVGYSSVYFLNRYPDLKVILVEPDQTNVELCRRNLLPYADRARIIHAGVWSRPVGLVVTGADWAARVREATPQETPDVQSTDISSLISLTPDGEVDLLKVDIEWSEIVVFGDGADRWLPKVHNIAIELHETECETVFFKALESCSFECSRFGELTFCLNMRPRSYS